MTRRIPTSARSRLAEGALNVVYTRSGEGSVELPSGRYRVTATHGLEYTLDEQEVTVTAGQGATLRAQLERVVDTTGWVR